MTMMKTFGFNAEVGVCVCVCVCVNRSTIMTIMKSFNAEIDGLCE